MATICVIGEQASGERLVNTSGADVVKNQAIVMAGKFLKACEAIVSGATGGFEDLFGKIIQVSDFTTGEATFATANLPVYWNPADGKFSNTSTAGYSLIGYGKAAIASGVLTVECVKPVLIPASLTDVQDDIAEIKSLAGIPFYQTATLTAAASATPVHILTDAEVGSKKAYVTGAILKVDGATAWTDSTGTIVKVQDTNGSPVVGLTYAKAQLTGNGILVLGSTGVTIGDAVSEGSGFTAAKGLDIVADSAFDAGSDIKITVFGFIA